MADLCPKCGQGFDSNKHKRTRHGVCLRCVRDWINVKTPHPGNPGSNARTQDQKQAMNENDIDAFKRADQ